MKYKALTIFAYGSVFLLVLSLAFELFTKDDNSSKKASKSQQYTTIRTTQAVTTTNDFYDPTMDPDTLNKIRAGELPIPDKEEHNDPNRDIYHSSDSSETDVFNDPRIPNFKRTRDAEYKDTSITYFSGDWNSQHTMTVHTDVEKYEYYHSLPRYYAPEDFHYYIDDENNKKVIKSIVDCILENNEEGKTKDQLAYNVIHLVQSIPYQYDIDSTGEKEFPKYPIETLYEGCGDCEDMSILLAGALREMNYGVCFFVYDNHVAVGIQGGEGFTSPYFEYNGKKYYYIEATSEGRNVGDIPEDYQGITPKIVPL